MIPTKLRSKKQQTLSSRSMKKTMPRHIILTWLKTGDEEEILKAAGKKKTCYIHRNIVITRTNTSKETVEQKSLKY